jgi:23S rRNA pseudouridine2604 synthase
MKTRLNKYLADRGVCSRRKADEMIKNGRVFVNGARAALGIMVGEDDEIKIDNKMIVSEKPASVYFAFHKPVGIITSVDPKARDSVLSFLKIRERVFPIGRLDVASSGLLLLTNDGRLSERITHPRYDHEKEYAVTVDREIRDEDLRKMSEGMVVLGSMTKQCVIKKIGKRVFNMILTEGRNRQIRRMCEGFGYEVKKLVRVRVMNIELGNLPVGACRPLTKKEINTLLRLAHGGS